jgi:hypothetical protein
MKNEVEEEGIVAHIEVGLILIHQHWCGGTKENREDV